MKFSSLRENLDKTSKVLSLKWCCISRACESLQSVVERSFVEISRRCFWVLPNEMRVKERDCDSHFETSDWKERFPLLWNNYLFVKFVVRKKFSFVYYNSWFRNFILYFYFFSSIFKFWFETIFTFKITI